MADPLTTMFSDIFFYGKMLIAFVIFGIIAYIYSAIALMAIAKKTKSKSRWMAWVPILNVYLMTRMAGIPGWWTLIIFAPLIPVIGSIAVMVGMVYFWWLIAEKIHKPGWWGILMVIPIVNLVLMGIMAWGE